MIPRGCVSGRLQSESKNRLGQSLVKSHSRLSLCYGMIQNPNVDDFIRQAEAMLRVLRSDSSNLSNLDLHRLTTHLHLLEIEASNLQTLKKLQPVDRAA